MHTMGLKKMRRKGRRGTYHAQAMAARLFAQLRRNLRKSLKNMFILWLSYWEDFSSTCCPPSCIPSEWVLATSYLDLLSAKNVQQQINGCNEFVQNLCNVRCVIKMADILKEIREGKGNHGKRLTMPIAIWQIENANS